MHPTCLIFGLEALNSTGGGGGVGVGVGGGGGGGGCSGSGAGMMSSTSRSPFTVSQWQELEHQALIYKYMVAGLPVPPDLVIPIQKSFDSISHSFFHHPALSYCSFYGKKVDPEPGRCRRTDGKKWRCSKEAYPDSKYCERHMHRGRNRSRKPVESQSMTQSSSTVTSLTATTGGSSGTGSYQNLNTITFANPQGTGSGAEQTHYHLDSIPYGIPSREYRYLQGNKSEGGEQSFFSKALGSNKELRIETQLENTLMPTRVASFSTSRSNNNSILQGDYLQNSYISDEHASGESVKHEGQSLRPFFDEWPRSRDSWSGLEATQLSMSIPMSASNFSTASSQSSHGETK